MNENEQNVEQKSRELATRLYELDAKVYHCLGTLISRSYTGDREKTIDALAEMMVSGKPSQLRSELAMVANMAGSIPDKKDRARLLNEYDSILQEVLLLPHTIGSYDIKDQKRAKLNESLIGQRFSQNNHLIICISRTMGCAGTDIGFALADALQINFYDTGIFETVLERLEAKPGEVADPHASVPTEQYLHPKSFMQTLKDFKRYHGLPRQDAVFFNQTDLLCEMAQKEDFVVMGRCADRILTYNHIPHISIFIDAPFDLRVRYTMDKKGLNQKKAVRLLKKVDRQRGGYYRFYTGRKWGAAANYDLCINSACYGIEGSVDLITRLIDRHLPEYRRKKTMSANA